MDDKGNLVRFVFPMRVTLSMEKKKRNERKKEKRGEEKREREKEKKRRRNKFLPSRIL